MLCTAKLTFVHPRLVWSSYIINYDMDVRDSFELIGGFSNASRIVFSLHNGCNKGTIMPCIFDFFFFQTLGNFSLISSDNENTKTQPSEL